MKEYTFYYTETNYGVISVEAENEEQARELANECASEGDVSWGDSDGALELDEVKEIDNE